MNVHDARSRQNAQTYAAADRTADHAAEFLFGLDRRGMVEDAARQFALTGLHGTTTAALAGAAGISEPTLYLLFESKDRLFREAVEHNIDARLRELKARLASVPDQNAIDCIARMAEETVASCVSDTANAVLTNWALLEKPDFTLDLHRAEAGAVCLMWERQLARCHSDPRSRAPLSIGLVHQIAHACLAFGFRLASLRHSGKSAAPLAREFAESAAQLAAGTRFLNERGSSGAAIVA